MAELQSIHINNPAAPLYPPERKLNERGFAEYGSLSDDYDSTVTLRQSSHFDPHLWLFAETNPALPPGSLHLSPDNVRWLRERLGEYLDDIGEAR